jgi:hypothetical protein
LAVGAAPGFSPNSLFRPVLPGRKISAEAIEARVLRAQGRVTAGGGGGQVTAAGLPPSILGMGLPSDPMAEGANKFG